MLSPPARRLLFIAALHLLATPLARAESWPELSAPAPASGGGENDAAVILGIENYAFVPRIPGAAQNAKDWYQHLTRTLKVPPARVKLLLDVEVTDDAMRDAAQSAAAAVRPGGTLWFVFIGHGAPADDGKDGVLVGADAQQTVQGLYKRSVRQKELLALLGKGAQARTVAIIDACFSGKVGTGAPLVEGLQPLLTVKSAWAGISKAVVLTAGAANQFAGPLPDANRPAFSYLVLGALRGWGDLNADGQVTAEEAVTYARETIETVVKGRRQTPELAAGDGRVVLVKGAKEKGPDLVAFVVRGDKRQPAGIAAPDVKSGGPTIRRSAISEAVGELAIDVKPKEGVRLELTTPSGKTLTSGAPYRNAEAEPGKWRVVAKASGYEDEGRDVFVAPDEVTAEKFALKLLGGLSVTGKPAGAAVKVTGPGGFADESGMPWEASGLKSGSYHVEVSRKGYEKFAKDVTVEAGQSPRVEVELVRQPDGRGCPPGMAFVPGGSFKPGAGGADVTVAAYCMDVTEVTVDAYAACVRGGRCSSAGLTCEEVHSTAYANWGRPGRGNHPINCVDWRQADAFCRAAGKRLPTEEEWEWAARGGEKGTKFPWGNEEPGSRICWDGEGSDAGKGKRESTCVVGSHTAGDSPLGIHDLAGNVTEWTGTTDGDGRICRGAAWSSDEANWRFSSYPQALSGWVGFRCASTP